MITVDQFTLEFDHRPAMSGEDFLVAPNNSEAVEWIDKWPDWPSVGLCLFGSPGCGKTHLAEVFRAKSGAETISIDHLLDAYQPPAGRAVIIENVDQKISADHEEGLFHLYYGLKDQGGNLLMTGSTPPSRWAIKLADLRSRLNTATAVEIGPPDDGLITAVLVKLFQDHQIQVSGEVVNYAVSRMERSFAAARALVEASDKLSLSEKKRITVPLIRRVLEIFEQEGET